MKIVFFKVKNKNRRSLSIKGSPRAFGINDVGLMIIALIFSAWAISHVPSARDASGTGSGVLHDMVIAVDAGHGGFDPGAMSASGKKEAPLNLAVAKALQDQLIARGAIVIMTRGDDEALGRSKYDDMQQRRRLISQQDIDAVISVHMNSYKDSSAKGPMVFYYPGSENGRLLAQAIQDELDSAIGSKARKAKSDNFFMLRETPSTSALVECGFLSNPNDAQKLQNKDYQIKIAYAIADGLEKYFSNPVETTS